MISVFDEKKSCCGCTACKSICPTQAIVMKTDKKGFLYPNIDEQKCINCGLCKKTCPFGEGLIENNELGKPLVYAAKHKMDNIRIKSSSGGVFTAISDYIIKNSGVIYGAAFDKDFNVCHQRAVSYEQRDKFRGSKYVQSDLKDIFKQVKDDLNAGLIVLFSGTPCQIAGLSNYLNNLKINEDKLYLCDIVCHGTPSPSIFKDYLNYMGKKNKSKPYSVNFRYKPMGWRHPTIKIIFYNNKTYYSYASDNCYYQLFSHDLVLRDSCYYCKYSNLYRPSDITIGDFWGIEKSIPEFDDDKGVSLVLINSNKGLDLFNIIKNNLNYVKSDTVKCMQTNLKMPSTPSPRMQEFWDDYFKYGFKFVIKKYTNDNIKYKIISHIKKILKIIGLFDIVKQVLKSFRIHK